MFQGQNCWKNFCMFDNRMGIKGKSFRCHLNADDHGNNEKHCLPGEIILLILLFEDFCKFWNALDKLLDGIKEF